MDAAALFLGLVFGSIGMGYLVYGKKQKKGIVLASGLGLIGIPYLISNTWVLMAVCAVLIILPLMAKDLF